MNTSWYYVTDHRQTGPVSETELQELAAQGRVGPETLAWREGMEDWIPLGELPEFRDLTFSALSPEHFTDASSPGGQGAVSLTKRSSGFAGDTGDAADDGPMVWCAECGQPTPEDGAIRYGDKSICAACKPTFIQRLKEGGTVAGGMSYAGFWIRVWASILDFFTLGIPLYALVFLVNYLMGNAVETTFENPWLEYGSGILITALEAWLVFHFGGTPGKLLLKLRIVNEDGAPVNARQAVGRSVWSTVLAYIPVVGLGLYFLDCLKAAFDPQKRALHDDLFKTRVIRLE